MMIRKRNLGIVKLSILGALLLSYALGASGKIAGKITSAENNDPLPGVNVIVEELSIGAATDIDGNYVILNVPPGDYTVRVTAIGYQNVRLNDLRVSMDQTSRQDFALALEVLVGQEVVVTAERKMVRKDLTATQKITTSDEIKELPVETFLGVLTTQAGVNVGADGALHVRGGRSNEVGYYIDGISVANPFTTNGLAVNISNKALEEMKVVSGAFNAEYGNAMSGIVNIQIKEGDANYEGSLTVRTGDYVSGNDQIFMNIDDVNLITNKTVDWALSGPIPFLTKPGIFTFNFSGRYANNEGYLYGMREHNPDDWAFFLFADYWFYMMGGDSSYVAMNPNTRFNTLTKLTYRITPKLKISAQYINDSREYKEYTHDYKYNPDGTYQYFTNNSNLSFKLNQSLGNTFYTINAYHSTTDHKKYLYEDPYDSNYVSSFQIMGTPPTTTFLFGGTQMDHVYQTSTTDGGKFDITSQVSTMHEVKIGASVRVDQLQDDNFTILYDSQEYVEPTVLEANDSPWHNYYDEQATFYSAYIQDKMEYPNMIVNVGIRGDYFDPHARYIDDLLHPEADESWKDADPKTMISPRLGVSFPITDEGILHFSYGHFYQLPSLSNLYRTRIFGAGLAPTVGNANLKPEKTILYEFGLQQQLTRILAIETSIFYKDIRDLLATQSIRYDSPNYGPSNYAIYLNKDYGAVKGIALSLTKRWDRVSKTSAFIDYSYQVTEGNSVSSGSFYFNALTGEEEEKKIVPLSWDQSHILNATVTFSEPGSWALSLIGGLSTGWPHTPNIPTANYVPRENSARKPIQQNVDLRGSKNFRFGGLNLTLLVQVYNLFDILNERYVYDDTGRAGYTYVNRSAEEIAAFIAHYGEPGIHTWEEYQVRPSYYTAPRSVQLGLTVEF
ncbi:MAG: TonB-dependent receptor [Candidatus Neomarinimicrobiota bacterium]